MADIRANIGAIDHEKVIAESTNFNSEKCEVTAELISEAMNLPDDQIEARLQEIRQHQRFLASLETRRRIIKQKNHRPFNDTNVGLCLVCFDESFRVIYPFEGLFACEECIKSQSTHMEQR